MIVHDITTTPFNQKTLTTSILPLPQIASSSPNSISVFDNSKLMMFYCWEYCSFNLSSVYNEANNKQSSIFLSAGKQCEFQSSRAVLSLSFILQRYNPTISTCIDVGPSAIQPFRLPHSLLPWQRNHPSHHISYRAVVHKYEK